MMRKMSYFLCLCLAFAATPLLASEKSLMKKYPSLFSRKKATLTVVTEKGKKTFVNNLTDEGPYDEAILLEYLPKLKVAVIEHHLYEQGQYDLLSLESGEIVSLPERPQWHADLFANASNNEMDDAGSFKFGYCNGHTCWILTERAGLFGEIKWLGKDKVQIIDGTDKKSRLVCEADRKAHTARCNP